MNQKYPLKLRHDMAEALKATIDKVIQRPVEADEDKMHLAVLAELSEKLHDKLYHYRKEYTLQLRPAQAFALRILYTDYLSADRTSYLGNGLLLIASGIHQYYQ